MELTAWRKAQRAHLIAKRRTIDTATARRWDDGITRLLLSGFPMLCQMNVGFYWPMEGEVDPRVAAHRLRSCGSRTGLPVVVAKRTPLEFREWMPGVRTVPGVFGLPVPQSAVLRPDALLIPPVGFDSGGFRLGYGGGYFDRTLASLAPQPLKIGLAREAGRMPTIRPQPHDVPMDFVITEAGVHEVTESGLHLEPDVAVIAERATLRLEARVR